MPGRVTAHWSVDISRSPAEVFAYLADVSKHGEWSPKPYRVEGVQPGPVTKGTTFTSYGWIPGDKEHRNDVEATEVAAPNRLVLTSTEGEAKATFVNTFTVTSSGNGCHVVREIDMPKPPGALGVVFPLLLRGFIKPAVQKGMNQLKERAEAQPSS